MNKYILTIALGLLLGACNSGNNQKETIPTVEKQQVKSGLSKIDSLVFYYQKIKGNNTSVNKNYENYNRLFPNNFKEFTDFFGFDLGAKPLYHYSMEYLELFFHESNDKAYRYQKMINIAKDGEWDADAVGYFQRKLREVIDDSVFTNTLSKQSFRTQLGFWFFYFDYVDVTRAKIPKELLLKLQGKKIMTTALKKGFELARIKNTFAYH